MNPRRIFCLAAAAACLAAVARAQAPGRGPTSKIYVADTEGEIEIDAGKGTGLLRKKAVYRGEGTSILTKANSNASIVLSNGTGIYFDVSTRTGIRSFVQAPFKPNRTDMEDEPSVSRTHLYIASGAVAVSTSRMAAGSTLLLETPLAAAEIQGRQVVIEANDDWTRISIFDGGASVRAGEPGASYEVKAGEQMIVRPGKPGRPNLVEISPIAEGTNEGQRVWLFERVLTADAARKLVYFYMQSGKDDDSVTLFDGDALGGGDPHIVVVPVVPSNPPVQPTVSAANLFSRQSR
jgi:hypothetical protein